MLLGCQLQTTHGVTIMARAFFFLAALAIIALIITGAIQLQRTDDTITIQINKDRVRQDAKTALDRGRDVLRKAEKSLDDPAERK
jgi:hypothetical protein